MIYIVRYEREIIASGEWLYEAVENANLKLDEKIKYEDIECLESPYTLAQKGFIYYTTTIENGFAVSR